MPAYAPGVDRREKRLRGHVPSLRKQRKRALDGLAKQVHTANNLGMGLIRTRMMRDHTSHRRHPAMLAQSIRLSPAPPLPRSPAPPRSRAIFLQHNKY